MFQLQHIYSNKYVAISNIQTSKTENENMQVLAKCVLFGIYLILTLD